MKDVEWFLRCYQVFVSEYAHGYRGDSTDEYYPYDSDGTMERDLPWYLDYWRGNK